MCLAILINKVYNKIYNVVSHIRLNFYVSTSIKHIYAIQMDLERYLKGELPGMMN
jgi:hypothetical protein